MYEGLASYKGLAFANILYVSFYTFLTKNVQEFTLSYKIPIKLVKNVYDFYTLTGQKIRNTSYNCSLRQISDQPITWWQLYAFVHVDMVEMI